VVEMLGSYLRELRGIRPSGVKETAFYPALSNLLNAAGASLKPRVRCVINPRNQGAGIPDGGTFMPDGLPEDGDTEPSTGNATEEVASR
jgi:hypothetical protein